MVAALLFPASLLLGSMAFPVLFWSACCMGTVWVALWLIRLWRTWPGAFPRPRQTSLLYWAAMLSIGICFAYFCWQNLLLAPESDGLSIWAWRASLLFRRGALTRELWPEAGDNARVLAYPPLVPLLEAFIGGLRGDSLSSHCKAAVCLFYGSLGLSLYAAGRSIAGATPAIMMTAAVLVLPGMVAGTNLTGFADLPMAALVAAIFASVLEMRTIPIGARPHSRGWWRVY